MFSTPTLVKRRSSSEVEIGWPDGLSVIIQTSQLRAVCPCASCGELRGDTTHATPLTGKKSALKIVEHTQAESTSLVELWAIGSYAIGFRWGDGHDTGIFPYPLLRSLCESTQKSAVMDKR